METPPPPRAMLVGGPQALWEPRPPAGALQTPERCVWPSPSVLEGDSCPQGLFEAISAPPCAGPQQVLGQGSCSDLNHWSGQGVAGWPCAGPRWSRRGRPAALETVVKCTLSRWTASAMSHACHAGADQEGVGGSVRVGEAGRRTHHREALCLHSSGRKPRGGRRPEPPAGSRPLAAPGGQAIVLGTKLRLQADLDVEKDKADLVERYVDGFPDLQRRLLALMDSWCQPGFDIRVVARRYPQTTSRLERLSPRALGRQVLRLLERHGLDPALCPNVVTQQRLAALRVPRESWAEHVQGLVGQDQGLQEQLLQLLASHDDAALVAQCALDLLLPEERLPASVAAELRQLRIQERTAEAPLEDGKDDYYQLPISREHLHFLASWEDLARHQEELLQAASPGPQPSGGQAGYGMAGDLRSLGASCPALAQAEKQLQGSVDLLQVHRQVSAGGMLGGCVPCCAEPPAQRYRGRALTSGWRALSSCGAVRHGGRRACPRAPRGVAKAHAVVSSLWGRPLTPTGVLFCRCGRQTGQPQAWTGPQGRGASASWCGRAGAGELPPLQKASASPQQGPRPCSSVHTTTPPGDVCRAPLGPSVGRADLTALGTLAPHRVQGGPDGPRLLSGAVSQVPAGEDAAPEVPARAFRVVCDSMLQGLARRLRCLGIDVLKQMLPPPLEARTPRALQRPQQGSQNPGVRTRVLPAAPTPSNEEAGAGGAEGICPGLQGEAPSLPDTWSWCPGEEDVVVPRGKETDLHPAAPGTGSCGTEGAWKRPCGRSSQGLVLSARPAGLGRFTVTREWCSILGHGATPGRDVWGGSRPVRMEEEASVQWWLPRAWPVQKLGGTWPGRAAALAGARWRRVCPDGPPAAAFVLGWLLAVHLYVPLGGSAALGTPTVTDVLSVSWFCFLSFPACVLSPAASARTWGRCGDPAAALSSSLWPHRSSWHLRGSPASLPLRLRLPVMVWKQPLRGLCLELVDAVSQGGDSDVSSRRVLCAVVRTCRKLSTKPCHVYEVSPQGPSALSPRRVVLLSFLRVARREGRIILTSGLPYRKLRAQVGAGRCLSVDCSLKARQQATAVIRHFNVRVTHSDIFSRCQVGAACPLPALGQCGSPGSD
ncbi:hypothetical protein E2I00_003318, partial [Balaenoptera physalus]